MSKLLVLMRHAQAGQASDDYDRPLTEVGRKTASTVGTTLRAQSVSFDRILSSSALRASSTTALVCAAMQTPVPVEESRTLYLASADETLQALRALPEDCGAALLVGHNPGMSELARRLLRQPVSLSPGQYIQESWDIHDWSELGT